MQIIPNSVVSLSYTLTLDSGEIADQTNDQHPLVFIHGIGQTLEAFDKHLEGLNAGDTFNFSISAEDGYGVPMPDRIIRLSRSIFDGPDVPADLLVVGNIVPMQDQDGNPLQGTILEVTDDSVNMDFNHPMAGQNLNFTGKVIEVREASQAELEHGHVHGPGGHHH